MNLDPIVTSERGGLIAQGDAASATGACERFDLVVFCAEEFQPHPSLLFRKNPQVRVLYAPNDDAGLTQAQLQIATRAAEKIAVLFDDDKRILVTCMEGRNRSGLVTALAIHLIYGIGGSRAIRIVQRRRRGARALTNPNFVDFLKRLPAAKS